MEKNNIIIKDACIDDTENIFLLSNEDSVRKNSFVLEKIDFEKHKVWYKQKLEDLNCIFLTAKVDGFLSGQVRLDIFDDYALIGVSVDPKFRGLGISKLLIESGIKKLENKNKNIKKIIAQIKIDNNMSVKLFKKCGFVFYKKILNNGFDAFEYNYIIK